MKQAEIEEYNENIVEAITELANTDRIKQLIEPNILWHKTLNTSEVARVLKSYLLFVEQLEKDNDTSKI